MNGYIARIFTSFVDVPNEIYLAIYFSGCSIRCKNCHNKDLWEKRNGDLMSDEQILERVKENSLIEGVVFLGGEPTDQMDFLIHMCNEIKNKLNLPVALYTGREFECLPKKLTDNLELIVCGPYRQDLHVEGAWPASSNQRVFKKKGNLWKS